MRISWRLHFSWKTFYRMTQEIFQPLICCKIRQLGELRSLTSCRIALRDVSKRYSGPAAREKRCLVSIFHFTRYPLQTRPREVTVRAIQSKEHMLWCSLLWLQGAYWSRNKKDFCLVSWDIIFLSKMKALFVDKIRMLYCWKMVVSYETVQKDFSPQKFCSIRLLRGPAVLLLLIWLFNVSELLFYCRNPMDCFTTVRRLHFITEWGICSCLLNVFTVFWPERRMFQHHHWKTLYVT